MHLGVELLEIFFCGSTPIFLLRNSGFNPTSKLLGHTSLQQTSKQKQIN